MNLDVYSDDVLVCIPFVQTNGMTRSHSWLKKNNPSVFKPAICAATFPIVPIFRFS
jgi:hypothetical protein